MAAWLYIFTKLIGPYIILKRVNFITCKLYVNKMRKSIIMKVYYEKKVIEGLIVGFRKVLCK